MTVKVFVNGVFDLLNSGHVQFLIVSKTYGDYLIVGINSDESVRRLKGKGRPIQAAFSRQFILQAMQVVDEVIIFDEDTPLKLIKRLRPDVLLIGEDHDMLSEQCQFVGGYGGKLFKFTQRLESTTNLIRKIKELPE